MASGGFDILSHIMETYFSPCDAENVSDDISEALMRGVIRDLRASLANPEDYDARSNLMWESTMAENRIIKLGKKGDFQCHQMEHQPKPPAPFRCQRVHPPGQFHRQLP